MPAPSPERAKALAEGLPTYSTGRPCKRGHVAERYTATKMCTRCHVEWRSENIDRERARESRWRASNRDVANYRSEVWRKTHPERQRSAEINYRAANPEKRKQTCSRYRQTNPEKERETGAKWRAANKPHLAAKSAARRALKKQATPPWAKMDAIAAIYAEAARRTAETGEQWEVDHIIPLVHKLVCGLHCEQNLQIIPEKQNRQKHNFIAPEVLQPIALI